MILKKHWVACLRVWPWGPLAAFLGGWLFGHGYIGARRLSVNANFHECYSVSTFLVLLHCTPTTLSTVYWRLNCALHSTDLEVRLVRFVIVVARV